MQTIPGETAPNAFVGRGADSIEFLGGENLFAFKDEGSYKSR